MVQNVVQRGWLWCREGGYGTKCSVERIVVVQRGWLWYEMQCRGGSYGAECGVEEVVMVQNVVWREQLWCRVWCKGGSYGAECGVEWIVVVQRGKLWCRVRCRQAKFGITSIFHGVSISWLVYTHDASQLLSFYLLVQCYLMLILIGSSVITCRDILVSRVSLIYTAR